MVEGSPRHVAPQGGLYTQIAVLAAGNALSLAVFLMLYHVSAVMSDFRDPMLYAFLCSVALRGPKDWMVEQLSDMLARRGSMFMAFVVVAPPRMAFQWIYREAKQAIDSFQDKIAEIHRDYAQDRNYRLLRNTSGGNETESEPEDIYLRQEEERNLEQKKPNPFLLYAKAGLRTFRSMTNRPRHVGKSRKTSFVSNKGPTPSSTKLVRWLLVLCILWRSYEWVRDSWSSTIQVLFFTFMLVIVSTSMLFPWLGRSFNFFGSITRAAASPTKTPQQSFFDSSGSPGREGSKGSLSLIRQRLFTDNTPLSLSPRPHLDQQERTTNGQQDHDRIASKSIESKTSSSIEVYFRRVINAVESTLQTLLLENIHAIVTLILIIVLITGMSGTTIFLGFRMANEARTAVVTAKNAFPASWPGTMYSPSSDSFGVATSNIHNILQSEEDYSRKILEKWALGIEIPPWLAAQQKNAMNLVQKALPTVASWLEYRMHSLLQAHNLTEAFMDLRYLYESAQGPRICSEREYRQLLVELSRADVAFKQAQDEERDARLTFERIHDDLSRNIRSLEDILDGKTNNTFERCSQNKDSNTCSNIDSTPSTETMETSSVNTSYDEIDKLYSLEMNIVVLESKLTEAKKLHASALSTVEEADRTRQVASSRRQLCQNPASKDNTIDESESGIFSELSERLESAYSKIFWHFRLREGLNELRDAVTNAYESLMHGSETAADLSRLQRVVQAAAIPLIAAGRVIVAPLGSSAAAAVMGSFSLLRLGLGVFHLGVQSTLFLTLLYYLLSAKKDPLTRAVSILPLPPLARQHAANAINAALGGVLVSLLKLAAAHGLYTWLTFRALQVPMAYTASVASAAFALLPFVPTYAVAVPGSILVAAQGRIAVSLTLFALHFAGYSFGDTILLEDSGGHPFMMSLSILGGLWAFSNPLLGCLLGPILLSLLTAVASLHTDLMANQENSWQNDERASPRRLLSDHIVDDIGNSNKANILGGASLQEGKSSKGLAIGNPPTIVTNKPSLPMTSRTRTDNNNKDGDESVSFAFDAPSYSTESATQSKTSRKQKRIQGSQEADSQREAGPVRSSSSSSIFGFRKRRSNI